MTEKPPLKLVDALYSPHFGEWTDHRFDGIFLTIRRYAGHQHAKEGLRNLTNENVIAALEENIVDRLARYRDVAFGSDPGAIIAANNAIALLQLLRYENLNHASFFEEVIRLTHRNNPHFVPIIRQRIQDILLRGPGRDDGRLLPYLDFAERRAYLGDIAGWVDCQWRYSSVEIDRADYDSAERRLIVALNMAHASYREDPKIFLMSTEGSDDKIANIHRSLARLNRLRGRAAGAAEMLLAAREHLDTALEKYKRINQVHGVANCFFEKGLLQIAADRFASEQVKSTFHRARTLYEIAGDAYKVAICDAIIARPHSSDIHDSE